MTPEEEALRDFINDVIRKKGIGAIRDATAASSAIDAVRTLQTIANAHARYHFTGADGTRMRLAMAEAEPLLSGFLARAKVEIRTNVRGFSEFRVTGYDDRGNAFAVR